MEGLFYPCVYYSWYIMAQVFPFIVKYPSGWYVHRGPAVCQKHITSVSEHILLLGKACQTNEWSVPWICLI